MSCDCAVCRDTKATQKLLVAHKAPKELSDHVWKLWERIAAAETDAAHLDAILRGTWPQADQIMRQNGWIRA